MAVHHGMATTSKGVTIGVAPVSKVKPTKAAMSPQGDSDLCLAGTAEIPMAGVEPLDL